MTDEAFTEEVVKPETGGSGVTKEDFVAYIPIHTYIFTPCREMWTGSGVNARVPKVVLVGADGQPLRTPTGKAEDSHAHGVARSKPASRANDVVPWPADADQRSAGGARWLDRAAGCDLLQSLRPPRLELGDASQAGPWLDHVRAIYPDDADHIVKWLAHRVQRPAEKINHALVLGGAQGIGKDTLARAGQARRRAVELSTISRRATCSVLSTAS